MLTPYRCPRCSESLEDGSLSDEPDDMPISCPNCGCRYPVKLWRKAGQYKAAQVDSDDDWLPEDLHE